MALYIPPSTTAPLGSGRRTSHSGGAAAEVEGVLCDHTLTQVLSWLGVTDLAGSAALVCRQWQQASGCKEVWRRRMHAALLQLYAEGPASAPLVAPGGFEAFSPARLFKAVYCTNLLRNGEFLERGNSARSAAVGSARCISWVPTHNGKGLSWEYPLLDPALPLPPARATHLGGDGSPSEAARRTAAASRPINIPRVVARSSSGRVGSPAGGSLGSSPGSFGVTRTSPGPFEVGCVAPSCFRWSEVAQVVDLGSALQQQSGLSPGLAAAALASGAALEVSVWVASSARGGSPASECQVVVGLASPGDLDTAAAEGLAPECLAKATVPYGDQLPAGLPASEAQRLSSEAVTSMLATMGLSATRLEVIGPFAAGPEWTQLRVRLRLPAAVLPGTLADEDAAAAALASAPRLIVALRGRVAAIGSGVRGAPRGPKFMAARAVFVALDDE